MEYIKRANKGKGPVLIGIALSDKNDYDGLLERLSAFDPSYINLHGNENTLQYACLRTGSDNEKRIDESRFFSTLT